MVTQHRLTERGPQLGGRGRRLGAEDLVIVPSLAARGGGGGGHPIESSAAFREGRVRYAAPMPETPRPGPARASHLLIIGGAEDKLRQRQTLARFVSLAGGESARVVVISTASSLGDEATDLYLSLFRQLGIADVRGMRPLVREDANDRRLVTALEDATAVFMTGGNQLRLSSVIGGTLLGKALLDRHRLGALIAGRSAGAPALADHMLGFGTGRRAP